MTGRIPQHFIQDLVERTDIVALVGERVQLKKSGHNHQARCPFHDEKSPSFSVSETKQFYYCFGCGAHGNVIKFLMEYDRMEFVEAVEYLAAQQGLAIPFEDGQKSNPQQFQQRKESIDVLKRVADFYEQELKKSKIAIDYFKSRGLTGQIAKHFILGYAPEGWENLDAVSTELNDRKLFNENGLTIAPKNYARFRNRVMFPIRNARGQIVGFGGRALTKEDQPKYMNSPETPLFHKGEELYGLFEALKSQRSLDFAICVEGYMDVIALHQHGFPQAVATLGTAIGPKHIQKLLRHTNEIVFCFDGDKAGQNAAWKALTIALPLLRDGVQFRFLFLPEEDDPDSLIRRLGKAGFAQRLKNAKPLSEVFFELLKAEQPINTLDDKTRFAKQASEYLNTMPHGLYHELLSRRLAEILGLYRADLEHLNQNEKNRPQINSHPQPTNNLVPLIRKLLRMLLQEPKLANEVSQNFTQNIDVPGLTLFNWVLEQFQQNAGFNVGKLLTTLALDHPNQALLVELASAPSLLPPDALRIEFSDGLAQLRALTADQRFIQLQAKSRETPLNPQEKQELSDILDKSK